MELKKNPKKDLTRNSGIYFAIGLFLVMALTYGALEWKSFYKYQFIVDGAPTQELLEEAPPLTFVTPPPPPPPITPQVIEVIDDHTVEPESPIESTESNVDTEIIKVNKVYFEEIDEEIEVNWVTIEEVPVFPGCENEKDKRACFQTMMNKHIGKVFRYPEVAQEMGIEGKVFTQFTILEDGTIAEIKLRGPDKSLEAEANRIIEKLPKMKPGKQRERNVKVSFSIPITFQLQ